jgi:pyruvate-formate lyase
MKRLKRIKARLFTEYYQKKDWWGDELSIFDDDETFVKKPLVVRKALAVRKVCSEMPIELKADELIAGIATMSSVGFGHTLPKYETDDEAKAAEKVCLSRKSVWGHHNPYYPRILNRGLNDIIQESEEIKDYVSNGNQDVVDWYNAVEIALKSAGLLSIRYADLAVSVAKEEKNKSRKAELMEMAGICRKVPMQPADSFHEALQSVWFIHIILHSTLNYTSIGRADQYLWPFYKKDLESGKITEAYARELLGSFLVKFNERVQLNNDHIEDHFSFGDWSQGGDPDLETTHLKMSNDMDYTYGQSSNHWLQNCVAGGLTPEGKDGTNALTHMIIELVNELELIDPLVSVRLHKNSPPELIDTTAKALSKGGAQPSIFNDDTIVPGMVKHLGIAIEDARDYSNDGCWETIPYGRTEFGYGHIEVLLSLESALNRGKSFLNGNEIGIKSSSLGSFHTFDQLFDAFKEQVKNRIDISIENKLKYYDEVYKIAPVPFLSGILDDCLAKGKDLTQRGAKYRLYAPLITGLSHCADSLAAIKKVVYEEKKVSLEGMVKILQNNWEGEEYLRQYCLNRVPKFGNDDDFVDAIVHDILEFYCDYFDEWNKKVDWITFAPGIGTFENFPRLGYVCGASADGRLAQQPLASNFSPSFGLDKNGPTAVIKSATKFDLRRLNDGCPIDMRVNLNDQSGKGAIVLKDFIKSFLQLNGNILTISQVSTDTLRKAQKDPKKFSSLRVRLGGLTAYFVQLCPTQQEEYIRRSEHGF